MSSATRATVIDGVNLSNSLDAHITQAIDAFLAAQKEDGHWVYEFETDVTYPADYILMVRYLNETPDNELERKIGRYLRRTQLPDGGWPFFKNGPTEVSPSVCAYFALKTIGDSPNAEHMIRARRAILAVGGAETSNVFTRIRLAMHGIISWDAVPMLPVELMYLPKWFPINLSKFSSYWAQTNIVPLAVLSTKRAVKLNPCGGVRLDELFHCPPEKVGMLPRAPHQSSVWFSFFYSANAILRLFEPYFPAALRQRAIDQAVAWVEKRLHQLEGLAACFPMTVNALLMYDALGYSADHPSRVILRRFIDTLFVVRDEEAYCQVTVNPTWDTVLVAHALLETRDHRATAAARRGLEWLHPRQILNVYGDWAQQRPGVLPGGWSLQYVNSHYPDVDDTVMIVMAMHRADPKAFAESIERGRNWVVGMQSANGGWAAFEADNTHYIVDQLPFSDHGSLLDPPSADVTGRCLSMLAQLGESPTTSEPMRRGLEYLLREQEVNGSWYGRWAINYVHGTWSALSALNAVGMSHDDPRMKRGVEWLLSVQNEDGGWGEDGRSYKSDYCGHEWAPSTPSQTAWALLGLMAAGAVHHPAVARGVEWLLRMQCDHGTWEEEYFTGAAFPRLFYIRYHGYCKYYPLWALARYRDLKLNALTRATPGL